MRTYKEIFRVRLRVRILKILLADLTETHGAATSRSLAISIPRNHAVLGNAECR